MTGDGWFKLFMGRNTTVGWRSPQELGYDRSAVTQSDIFEWFGGLQSYLLSEVPDYVDIVNDPSRNFNCDESGFPLQVKKRKVMAEKGSKNVFQCTTPGHDQVTVMACFNANGQYMYPLIIFKGQRLRNHGMANFDEASFSTSSKGWMEKDNFLCFLQDLDDFVTTKEIKRPIILYMDGHSSHFGKDAAEFCAARKILLYCLPPHSSHILQPLDVGFFSSVKNTWRNLRLQWQRDNPGLNFTKSSFPGLFKKAWEKETTRDKAVNGFRKCGLFPLDVQAIDFTKIVSSKINPVIAVSSIPCPADSGTASSVASCATAYASSVSSAADNVQHYQSGTKQESDGNALPVTTGDCYSELAFVPEESASFLPSSSNVDVEYSSIVHVNNDPELFLSPIQAETSSFDQTIVPMDLLSDKMNSPPPTCNLDHTPLDDVPLSSTPNTSIMLDDIPEDHMTYISKPEVDFQNISFLTPSGVDDTKVVVMSDNFTKSEQQQLLTQQQLNMYNMGDSAIVIKDGNMVAMTDAASIRYSPSYVSSSFPKMLKAPTKLTTKPKGSKQKVPKAASGKAALAFFKAEEDEKRLKEVKKIKRKLEREKKKIETAAEKEKKKERREKVKLEREMNKVSKKQAQKKKTCSKVKSNTSNEEDSDMDTEQLASDDSLSDNYTVKCYICGEVVEDDDITNAIGCETCPRWVHKMCTNDEVLMDLSNVDDIAAYPFTCDKC